MTHDNMAYNNERPFTTNDSDNNVLNHGNCAHGSGDGHGRGGGWWFGVCSRSVLTSLHPHISIGMRVEAM